MRNWIFCLLIIIQTLSFAQSRKEWSKQMGVSGEVFNKSVTFVCGDNLFSCLGTDKLDFRKETWKYSFQNNVWQKVKDFPGELRISAVAFSIGNKAFVGSGLGSKSNNKEGLNDFWKYDAKENTWEKIANFPAEIRYGATAFTINGKGYVALGANQTTYYTDLWEYNPTTNQWTKKADFPDKGRVDASVFVINDEAYISFGQSKEFLASKKKSWKYSPTKNEWTQVADFPDSPRLGVIAFSYKNKGYALGGTNGTFKHYDEFWEFDALKNKWKENADIPFGSCSYGFAATYKDTAYIYSGKTKHGTPGIELWKYSLMPPSNNLMIGGRLLMGNDRMPHEGIEVRVLRNGKILQATQTNMYGTFFLPGLPHDKELTLSVDLKNAELKGNTFYLINRNGQEIAKLSPENNYNIPLFPPPTNQMINVGIDKKDLRMNLKGLLVWGNNQQEPLSNVPITLANEKETTIGEGVTDEKGNFIFKNIPVDSIVFLSIKQGKSKNKGNKILLVASNGDTVAKTSASNATFEMTNLPPEKNSLAEIFIGDVWLPQLINDHKENKFIEPILFEVAKWEILPEAKIILNKALILLQNNPKYSLDIAAYTDCRGDKGFNQTLSDKRANAVKEYFVTNGIVAGRITAKGFGESKPVNKCVDGVSCNEEEHAQNRRMELSVKVK